MGSSLTFKRLLMSVKVIIAIFFRVMKTASSLAKALAETAISTKLTIKVNAKLKLILFVGKPLLKIFYALD